VGTLPKKAREGYFTERKMTAEEMGQAIKVVKEGIQEWLDEQFATLCDECPICPST
jgi:hypothetical protein